MQPPTTSPKYHFDEILECIHLYRNQKIIPSCQASAQAGHFFLKAFSGNYFHHQIRMEHPSWHSLMLGSSILGIFAVAFFSADCILSFWKAETPFSSPQNPQEATEALAQSRGSTGWWINEFVDYFFFWLNKSAGCTVYKELAHLLPHLILIIPGSPPWGGATTVPICRWGCWGRKRSVTSVMSHKGQKDLMTFAI